jgi:GT2 family glycosyltransferase
MIVVITITCNRLELTKIWLDQLKKKSGKDFYHLIVDNGSKDGTTKWLIDHYYKDQKGHIMSLNGNYGIKVALKIGLKKALELGAKYVVKFDNDCEIHTNNILVKLLDWYKKGCDNYVIAPLDLMIPDNYMPRELKSLSERGFNVRYVSHTGGMFQVFPKKVCKLILDCANDKLIDGDYPRGHYFINNGISPIYLTDLHISHRGIENQTKNYKL